MYFQFSEAKIRVFEQNTEIIKFWFWGGGNYQRKVCSEFTWNSWQISLAARSYWEPCCSQLGGVWLASSPPSPPLVGIYLKATLGILKTCPHHFGRKHNTRKMSYNLWLYLSKIINPLIYTVLQDNDRPWIVQIASVDRAARNIIVYITAKRKEYP